MAVSDSVDLAARVAAGTPPQGRAGAGLGRQTSYLLGVSTRRVDKLVDQLGIKHISKSQAEQSRRPTGGTTADRMDRLVIA